MNFEHIYFSLGLDEDIAKEAGFQNILLSNNFPLYNS